jgi:isocitrate dehydrogenase kinase/phosphatase
MTRGGGFSCLGTWDLKLETTSVRYNQRVSQRKTDPVVSTAEAIRDGFSAYHAMFKDITRKAKQRFEECDWHGLQQDAETRLDLYKDFVAWTVNTLKEHLGGRAGDKPFWVKVKSSYTGAVADRPDFDLAESFYNSVAMRVADTFGLDPDIHYVGSEFDGSTELHAYREYTKTGSTQTLIKELLHDCVFTTRFRNLDGDTARAAELLDAHLRLTHPLEPVKWVEVADPIFFRGKGAYLVGRVRMHTGDVPLVISMSNSEEGIYVDAVLMTEDEVSIVFSFARSYFHVEVEKPHALVRFLKQIMPRKPIAELYISLGYNKHGKTELYRDLVRHLKHSSDKFVIAPGEKGMVMTVFTLPSYDVVFKVIKDQFDPPKKTTRQEVRNHYYLVFKHDRGGRLVDAQEFEHLRFDKDRFSPELLKELLSVAAQTVAVDGDQVEIKHLYTERRLDPLNLYVRQVTGPAAVEAVIDYGHAIKDLAYTNIFPGDILLKNFGVTRHGRVVFYDYDELCLLTDCNFRRMPVPTDPEDDYAPEPWFAVDDDDVFPEELHTFLGLPSHLAEVFKSHHGELFDVPFWSNLKKRHQAGDVIDIVPYKESRRLPHG